MNRIWSASLGTTWPEGVLAGTGVVGGVLYGAPEEHRLAVAHEDFFLPVNSKRPAPELAGVLPTVRDALRRGDATCAADMIDASLRSQDWDPHSFIWTDPLGPVAELVWNPEVDEWNEYRRDIAINDADVSVSWSDRDGLRSGMRVHGARGMPYLEIELWSQRPLVGRLALDLIREAGSDAATIEPENYSTMVSLLRDETPHCLTATVQPRGVASGPRARAIATMIPVSDQALHPRGGWRISNPPGSILVRLYVDALSAPKVATSSSTGELADRSMLKLVNSAETSDSSTEAIWASARSGSAESALRMFEIAYAAGRRNIITSTGRLPPTLQGVWQATWSPAWSADYTMNGNVQLGSLASVLWTGTPGLMRSLFRLVRQYPDHYRSNARRVFGLPGMHLPARMSTHGHANHLHRDYPHEFWVGNGPWLLRLAVDYIQVSGDRSIVDEWLWEYAVEILDFCCRWIEAGGDRLSPSYSPENTPLDSDNPLVTDAASDIASVRDGLRVGAWLADLQGDPERARFWRRIRADLGERYSVADDGTLAEWSTRWQEHIAHRHSSQLHGLWYEPDELLLEPPLRGAVSATITKKIAWRASAPEGPPGNMEMAFGLSSLGLAAAALGDAGSAYQCALWLARDHFTSALSTTHDAGSIFNLDASGALPAVIASMLVQSGDGRLVLLPALPDEWPTGCISGLTARGGIIAQTLSWTPDGLHADIEFVEGTEWLRPRGLTIHLKRAGVARAAVGVHQTGPQTLRIMSSATRVEIDFDYLR